MTTSNNNGPLPSMPDLFKLGSENSFVSPPDVFRRPYDKEEPPKKINKTVIKVQRCDWKKALPEKTEKQQKDALFVTNYFNKVKTKLSMVYDPGGQNKFHRFVEILNSFDPYIETPKELYLKIEKLFGREYSDLTEEFILFLTFGQSAQIGRFMDHLYMEKMMLFIQKLNNVFEHRPTPLRKVLRCISPCNSSADLAKIKEKVLPLLKSNQLLTKMFLELLPDSRLPDSPDQAWETILTDRLLLESGDFDVWEFEDSSNERRRKLEHKKTVDTMYLQGRIFLQRGRMLRAARATYPELEKPNNITQDTNTSTIVEINKKQTKPRARVRSISKINKKAKADNDKIGKGNESSKVKRVRSELEMKSDCVVTDEHVKASKKVKFELDVGDQSNNLKRKFESVVEDSSDIKKPNRTKKSKVIDKNINSKKNKNLDGNLEEKHSKDVTDKKSTNNNIKSSKKHKIEDISNETTLKIVKEDGNGLKLKILRVSEKEIGGSNMTSKTKNSDVSSIVDTMENESDCDINKGGTQDCKSIKCDLKVVKTEGRCASERDRMRDTIWTREEDKTILEVLKSANVSDSTFFKIKNVLPHRSLNEIKDRFVHVIDLLQEMALGRG